jgi:hypothetical protein
LGELFGTVLPYQLSSRFVEDIPSVAIQDLSAIVSVEIAGPRVSIVLMQEPTVSADFYYCSGFSGSENRNLSSRLEWLI